MKKQFFVVAGKWEEYKGEQNENIKFADVFDSMEKAEQCVIENQLTSYPICRIEVTFF
ncbi:hypothetical protein ID850_17635 [Xenorhabdus sp. Flor]|uniref:hypothetical protein n=1 Tax=Xenorhabdus cabanillasii TaxID=351673 RepID=UPI001988B8E3|nr:hypothetical protein [Xenorhabdus sp. Flor]MBD2816521.1 hypothetical protein [Xenorhabdus sp. Flor]